MTIRKIVFSSCRNPILRTDHYSAKMRIRQHLNIDWRSAMALTAEEKGLIEEALQVYLQIVARQVPPQQVQQLATVVQGITKKLDSIGAGGGGKAGNKPAGITDEWYKNVCLTCDKLSPTGCTDKVTEKFPGKCDPILHYERDKMLKSKK